MTIFDKNALTATTSNTWQIQIWNVIYAYFYIYKKKKKHQIIAQNFKAILKSTKNDVFEFYSQTSPGYWPVFYCLKDICHYVLKQLDSLSCINALRDIIVDFNVKLDMWILQDRDKCLCDYYILWQSVGLGYVTHDYFTPLPFNTPRMFGNFHWY